jgi:hypothetical protein
LNGLTLKHGRRARRVVLWGAVLTVLLISGASATTSGAARTPVGAASNDFVRVPAGTCQAGDHVYHVGPQTLCTHGPDPAPTAEQLRFFHDTAAATIPAAYPNPPCKQDAGGYVNSYQRIRVMFGYPSDTTYDATDAARVMNWLRIADYSLSLRGGSQHYRFYCGVNASGAAYIQIRIVKLLPIGTDQKFTYNDLTYSLYYQTYYGLGTQNYRSGYHDYAVFVDNIQNVYPYGGESVRQADSRWDPGFNYNNSTSYSKVSLINANTSWGDFNAQTFMHETGHSLGAVQDDAPHGSRAGHCYDEYDTMCYNDSGPYFANGGSLTYPTPCSTNVPYQVEYFDCQRNDYYNAHPSSGTYIYSHWNLANSYWLTPRV